MKTLTTLFLFILLAASAYAGDKGNIYTPYMGDKGNIVDVPNDQYGGDAFVCRDIKNKIVSARLLDYVERDNFMGNLPIQFEANLTDDQFVEKLGNKLMRLSPDVFHTFKREAKKLAMFMQPNAPKHPNFVFVKNFKLNELQDMGVKYYEYLTRNQKCRVEQLVIRSKHYNGVTYWIQSEIYNKLSAADRRGIILHEAIYHTFNLYYGDTDSARTRFFNRNIMVKRLDQMTPTFMDRVFKNAYVLF